MAYQVLARKSRPQDFIGLIGQEPIVQALRNALTEGRIAQAYLFSGIRGVGKTSAARVLAKALNCESGPTPEPCNACNICQEITRGGDLDVIEVDAATYSKVEQVRELTESLRYGPARDRYKVVILDEVHRLSRQAFDALLKIIEEPPDFLVFIFATTEIEAVPATILSRCQEFRFRRVPSNTLAEHLKTIAQQENLTVSENALRLIARAGEGSVRDSVALLDQLATFGGGTIADDEATRLLGGLDTALFQDALQAMLNGDAITLMSLVRRTEADGRDPRHVYAQFLGYCRDALHVSLGGQREHLELPAEDAAALEGLAKQAGYENLLRLTHLLLGSEATVRRSEAGALALEIAWLRAAELPKLTRVEELLAGRPRQTKASPPPAPSAPVPPHSSPRPVPLSKAEAAKPKKTKREASEKTSVEPVARLTTPGVASLPEPPAQPSQPSQAPQIPSGPPEEPASVPQPSPAAQPNEALNEISPELRIDAFLEALGRQKQPLLVRVRAATKLEFDNGELKIHLAPGDDLLSKALERGSNREILESALRSIWGDGTTWRCLLSDRSPTVPSPETAAGQEDDQAEPEPETDPRIQTVLDIFGGTVDKIEKH